VFSFTVGTFGRLSNASGFVFIETLTGFMILCASAAFDWFGTSERPVTNALAVEALGF